MISYILRRTLAAVILLLVVSAVTFAIFFVLPRLAGQTADQLAQQYIGKAPSKADIAAVKHNLGLDQPVYVQYWHFIKGIVSAPPTTSAPPRCTATRRASATPSRPTRRSGRS